MKYYRDIDYFFYFCDFPHMGVPGATIENSDGTANIYINTLYSREVQHRTIQHELRHVAQNHFHNDLLTIEEKEQSADDINDGSCIFGPNFSFVEYVEDVCEEEIEDERVIPLFHSLEALKNFVFSERGFYFG